MTSPAASSEAGTGSSVAVRRGSRFSKRRTVANMLVMSLAVGIVVTMSVPSNAFSGGQAVASEDPGSQASQAQPQLVSAANVGDIAPIERDALAATTPQELQALRLAAARAESARLSATRAAQAVRNTTFVPGVRKQGDDYPWWNMGLKQVSPLRYYYRECVDFVAWRVNRDAGAVNGNWKYTWGSGLPSGSAYTWNRNWAWNKGNKAVAGSVAWFTGNHVAYVQAVHEDGSIVVEEYNWGSARHSYNKRTISANSVAMYLYPPGVG